MIDTIIFDLDGVIIDSEPVKKQAEVAAIKEHGVKIPKNKIEEYVVAPTAADGSHFKDFLAKHSDASHHDLYATRVKHYHQLIGTKLQLLLGVLDFLKYADKNFKNVGLVTSSYLHNQVRVFDQFDLYKYFDAIVTGTDIENFKPNPESYLVGMKQLKSKPEQTVVIENMPFGIQSGKAAGATVLAITWSMSAKALKPSKPDFIVDTYSEAKR